MKNSTISTALVMAMANAIGKFQRPSGTSPKTSVKMTRPISAAQMAT